MSNATDPAIDPANVDVFTYCKDPSKYKSSLPEETVKQFDESCVAYDEQRKAAVENAELLKEIGTIKMLEGLPYAIITTIFTDPVQMALIFGPTFLEKKPMQLLKFMQNHGQTLFKGAEKWMVKYGKDLTVKAVAKSGSVFASNVSVLTRSLQVGMNKALNLGLVVPRYGVRAFLWLSGTKAFAAVGAAAGALGRSQAVQKGLTSLSRLGGVLGKVMIAQAIVQVIGMIVDMADPCGLNKELSADVLKMMNSGMDDGFKKMMLPAQSYITSLRGEAMFTKEWPVDARVEQMFPTNLENIEVLDRQMEVFGITVDQYKQLEETRMDYIMMYKMNQRYNYLGQPLRIPSNEEVANAPENVLAALKAPILSHFSNNNVVVERWYNRYRPLIYVTIILIIFLIFRYV
jgi:hypothetical protein